MNMRKLQNIIKSKMRSIFNNLASLFLCVFIVLLFSNSFYIFKIALTGEHTPYKHTDKQYYHMQTINKEFEYNLWLRRDKEEQDLLTMEQEFIKFKQNNPQYKELKLYHTHKYIDVRFWTFWKWICYTPQITNKYNYLVTDK